MFAVVKTGGKQYRVQQGDVLRVEKLEGEPGAAVSLGEVLMSGDGDQVALGKGDVKAEIIRQIRADKVVIFKKKRRHNYRRKKGHRQYLTEVKVTGIAV